LNRATFFEHIATAIFKGVGGTWLRIPHVCMEIIGMSSSVPSEILELVPGLTVDSLAKVVGKV
jgi:hypothetical protein